MSKSSHDPLRAQLLELAEAIEQHTTSLRDFAVAPGNAWLAKGELQKLQDLLGDMDSLLEEIKQADEENGY